MSSRSAIVLLLIAVAACRAAPEASPFPKAHRPVAPIVSDSFSTEDARDRVGEAEEVMRLAGIAPGMSVADIGAGEGYYTVRLSPMVGPRGRVLAQDIIPSTRDRLAQRVQRENLDNVSVRLGVAADPKIPAKSFDRIFLVHMYHEVTEPYAFLWRLRPALHQGGRVIVVDIDRPTDAHGIPPKLLFCELGAVGYRLVEYVRRPEIDGYFAEFEATGSRPEPEAIRPCRLSNGEVTRD